MSIISAILRFWEFIILSDVPMLIEHNEKIYKLLFSQTCLLLHIFIRSSLNFPLISQAFQQVLQTPKSSSHYFSRIFHLPHLGHQNCQILIFDKVLVEDILMRIFHKKLKIKFDWVLYFFVENKVVVGLHKLGFKCMLMRRGWFLFGLTPGARL